MNEELEKQTKKKNSIIIGIISLIVILLGSTYAFFTYSRSVEAFMLTSGNIDAKFTAGTNSINFTNAYPISNTYAIANLDKLTYIDFTISGNVNNEDEAISYEIYLTEETGNTLNNQYIKLYLTEVDGSEIPKIDPKAYSTLETTSFKNSPDGKVIYKENVPGTFSKDFRLYVWLDSTYDQNSVSQTFNFKVNLYAYNNENQSLEKALQSSISNSTCNPTIVEDGITYLSGTNECINFNYVMYSDELWRATAIYPDGTIKLVTDDIIMAMNYGADTNFYVNNENKSNAYQFLNENFLNIFNTYESFIMTDTSWNATLSGSISTKLAETTLVTAPVGLLNSYEYYMSYRNASTSTGYLNIGNSWWLLNPYSSSNLWYVSNDGTGLNSIPSNSFGIRPSVKLKSSIQLISGIGTKESPFKIDI